MSPMPPRAPATANLPPHARHGALRLQLLAWLAALVLAAMAGEVAAQGCAGSLGFGSDNIYRGVSLSGDRPAWLADVHCLFASDWIAGVGATAQRPPHQSAAAQLTAYLNRRWRWDDDWSGYVGVMHYASPWDRWRSSLRYDELTLAATYRGSWRASVSLSPNGPSPFFASTAQHGLDAWSEVNFHQALRGAFGLDAGVGYAHLRPSGLSDYAYASAGLSYAIGDTVAYVSRVWSSNEGAYPKNIYASAGADEHQAHWTATLVWSF